MSQTVENLRAQIDVLRQDVQSKQPQKWGTFGQRIQYVQTQLALGTLALVDGTLLLFLNIILKTYVFYPLIFYGVILLLMRALVLWILSEMIKIGRLMVFIINAMLDFFYVGVNLAIEVIKIVITVVNGLAKAVSLGFGSDPIHASLKLWKKRPQITYSEFESALRGILNAAPKFNSMPKIFLFLTRVVLHEYTCEVVRYTWPVSYVYDVSEWFLGWTYYGSAEPVLETGMNCMASGDVTAADYIAAALGIGYLFLELFLPFVILFLIILFLGGAFSRISSLVLYLLENTVIIATEVTLVILDFVFA